MSCVFFTPKNLASTGHAGHSCHLLVKFRPIPATRVRQLAFGPFVRAKFPAALSGHSSHMLAVWRGSRLGQFISTPVLLSSFTHPALQ